MIPTTRTTFAIYTREIDYGQGLQTVYAKDGKIVKQFIGPADDLHHRYTGDGNPEYIGKDVNVLRGKGFTRLRNKETLYEREIEWLQECIEEDREEGISNYGTSN